MKSNVQCPMSNVVLALCFLGLLWGTVSAKAQKVTASITITNITTNGMTFTLNGTTRTFTNNVFNSATQVFTNADATGCGSKTNLLTQIQLNPFAQVVSADTGTNSFNLIGNSGVAMVVSVSAGYASFSYSTQTVASIIGLSGPVASLPTAQARTNVASAIVGGINAPENTNSILASSIAARQLVAVTNGFSTNQVLANGVGTNGFNLKDGNVKVQISPPDSGLKVSTLSSNYSIIISIVDDNSGTGDIEGPQGQALEFNVLGEAALFDSGGENVRMGDFEGVVLQDGNNHQAKLDQINGDFTLTGGGTFSGPGTGLTGLTATNLDATGRTLVTNIVAGSASKVSSSSGVASGLVATNTTFIGTNTFLTGADIAFARNAISSLANGINQDIIIGTNVYVEVSGPTGAFSIEGMAGGRDGKLLILLNKTGQQMTIASEGGATGNDPTAANRILTLGSAADLILTNAAVTFIYSGSASRWQVLSHNP